MEMHITKFLQIIASLVLMKRRYETLKLGKGNYVVIFYNNDKFYNIVRAH